MAGWCIRACPPPPLLRPQVPFWAKHRFHWTTFNVSTLLAFAGVILILIQTLGVRFLIPRFGEYRVLSVSVPLGIVQFALFGEWKACVCLCLCVCLYVYLLCLCLQRDQKRNPGCVQPIALTRPMVPLAAQCSDRSRSFVVHVYPAPPCLLCVCQDLRSRRG